MANIIMPRRIELFLFEALDVIFTTPIRANTMHGVEKLRAVVYGSIKSSAVPAMGSVIQQASNVTAATRAEYDIQQIEANIHAATRVVQMLAR